MNPETSLRPISFKPAPSAAKHGDVLIEVNTEKLDQAYSRDTGFYIEPQGKSAIGNRRERFLKWLEDNPEEVIEAPMVSWNDFKGCVGFTNGRHRFSVLRDLGYPRIEVTVPAAQANFFRQKFAGEQQPRKTQQKQAFLINKIRLATDESWNPKEYVKGIQYSNNVVDAHGGELFGEILARGTNGRLAGYIEYSVWMNEVHVKMIQTHKDVRRNGVARSMMKKLQEEYPECEINWGMTTDLGTYLRDGMEGEGVVKSAADTISYTYADADEAFDNVYAEQATAIANETKIYVSRDKYPLFYATCKGVCVGCLYVSDNRQVFSFDIVVNPAYQNRGIGKELVRLAEQEYEERKDAFGEDYKYDVDVVNPIMKNLLEERGFTVTDEVTPGKAWIMTKVGTLPQIRTEPIKDCLDEVRHVIQTEHLNSLETAELLDTALQDFDITFEHGGYLPDSGDAAICQARLVRASTQEDGSIVIEYDPELGPYLETCSDREWREFVQAVCSLVSHELTHREQLSAIHRDNDEYTAEKGINQMMADPYKEWEYYSNPHEIAAFARSAVEELRNVSYTDSQILHLLRNREQQKDSAGDSNTFWLYWDMFGRWKSEAENQEIWKRFLQAITKILQTKRASFAGYFLTPEARELILKQFPPKFPDIIADHVTTKLGGKESPAPAKIVVEGYASDDSLEALVVSIDGQIERPDGELYHITLSLDRSKKRRPKDSKAVIKGGWTPVQRFEVPVTPGLSKEGTKKTSPFDEGKKYDDPYLETGSQEENYEGGLSPEQLGITASNEDLREKLFEELADAQRGEPEQAMLRCQHHSLGSGLWTHGLEHIGDLTHRMSQKFNFFKGGYGYVKEKVDKILHQMRNEYGYERECFNNFKNNYAYAMEKSPNELHGTYEELLAELKQLGLEYAQAHNALPVYNEAQKTARDAAVALGKMDFGSAKSLLEKLEGMLSSPENWQRVAGEFTGTRIAAWRPIYKRHRKPGQADAMGELYLLHFNQPYQHARHYLGWSTNAAERIEAHKHGQGANLMRVIYEAGVGFEVAWIKPGTRLEERKIKNRGGLARMCPICKKNKLANDVPEGFDPEPPETVDDDYDDDWLKHRIKQDYIQWDTQNGEIGDQPQLAQDEGRIRVRVTTEGCGPGEHRVSIRNEHHCFGYVILRFFYTKRGGEDDYYQTIIDMDYDLYDFVDDISWEDRLLTAVTQFCKERNWRLEIPKRFQKKAAEIPEGFDPEEVEAADMDESDELTKWRLDRDFKQHLDDPSWGDQPELAKDNLQVRVTPWPPKGFRVSLEKDYTHLCSVILKVEKNSTVSVEEGPGFHLYADEAMDAAIAVAKKRGFHRFIEGEFPDAADKQTWDRLKQRYPVEWDQEDGYVIELWNVKKATERKDENGYWTGDGGASGVLAVCPATQRICLAWRSEKVHEGSCWGTIGGAVKKGHTPEENARLELLEETGYKGTLKLIPAYIFQDGDFRYYDFIGVVPEEFSLNPGKKHEWETDFIQWVTLDELTSKMHEQWEDFHPGFLEFLEEAMNKVTESLEVQHTAAVKDISTLTFFENDFEVNGVTITAKTPEGVLAGSITIQLDTESYAPSARIQLAQVEKDWRRTGLGQLLYDKAIDVSREKGAKKFFSDYERSSDADRAWEHMKDRHDVNYDPQKDVYHVNLASRETQIYHTDCAICGDPTRGSCQSCYKPVCMNHRLSVDGMSYCEDCFLAPCDIYDCQNEARKRCDHCGQNICPEHDIRNHCPNCASHAESRQIDRGLNHIRDIEDSQNEDGLYDELTDSDGSPSDEEFLNS